jgi:hypothetical protein
MKTKNNLLLASSMVGFIWWVTLAAGFIIELGKPLAVIASPNFRVGLSKYLSVNLQDFGWLVIMGILIVFSAASWALNFIGWKKGKSSALIIILYLFSLNFISIMLCVIGFLWDSKDRFDTQVKRKNPLFVIAGIFGIFGLTFWLIPTVPAADGSLLYSLYTTMLSTILSPDEIFASRAIAFNFSIALFGSYLFTMPLSFFGQLRDNAKKALIVAIFYIISLSIPSAILCFIGYALRKKYDSTA